MRTILGLAFTLLASAAYAQSSTQPSPAVETQKWEIDSRWAEWLGCWRAEDDLASMGMRICITPNTIRGVNLQTVIDDTAQTSETVTPDRVVRSVSDGNCTGTTRSQWSQRNQRVFRFTDVTCGNDPPRKLAGVAFLLEGPVLVDVQIAETSDSKSVRVRRLVPSGNQKLPDGSNAPRSLDARTAAVGAPWTVEDVIEASGMLPADAVQAAISEVSAGFSLNKKSLLAMNDAGVSPNVIDLMVALSYPSRFIVERASAPYDDGGFIEPVGWWDPFLSPMIPFSMLGRDCYSAYNYGPSYRCGYLSGLGYPMSFGYPYYSYSTYPYGGYQPGWVVLDSAPSGVVTNQPVESAEGRVVNGRGYTQIRNREPVRVPGSAGSGGGLPTDGGNSTSGTNSTGSSGVSSGGGYSGGGSSGGDSGRTAVPRPPGGGQ